MYIDNDSEELLLLLELEKKIFRFSQMECFFLFNFIDEKPIHNNKTIFKV